MSRPIFIAAVVFLSFLVAAPPGQAAWTWPVRGEVITPYRNGDDPYAGGQHRGIDIAGDVGVPVVAATPGEVRFAGVAGVSGLTVSLRTADGHYDTSYLHLSAVSVHEGDAVAAGDRLGAVGTTGTRSAVAPHLHFGVRDAGTAAGYHDPLGFLPPLATTGQPEPNSPAPAPEAVPSTPSPQPVPRPAPTAHRAPSPDRAPRPNAGRVPRTARNRVRHGAPTRAPHSTVGRVPHGAPGRVPHGAPGRVPHGAPNRVREGAPTRAPHSTLGRVPHDTLARVHASHPAASPEPAALADLRRHASHATHARGRSSTLTSHRTPARSGSAGDASTVEAHGRTAGAGTSSPRLAAAGSRAAHSNPAHPEAADAPGSARSSGPDAAWALACLGLLLAAALVGTSGGGRDFVKRRRAAVGRAVRPLLGRG